MKPTAERLFSEYFRLSKAAPLNGYLTLLTLLRWSLKAIALRID
ncbi:hypothetical protein [Synechocystis sp. PCC 7509]|nr:hypothetical protein [Synechocystis sp. PCC 7509]